MAFMLPNQKHVKKAMKEVKSNPMTQLRDLIHDLVIEAKDINLMVQTQVKMGDTRGREIIESEQVEELVARYMDQIRERIIG